MVDIKRRRGRFITIAAEAEEEAANATVPGHSKFSDRIETDTTAAAPSNTFLFNNSVPICRYRRFRMLKRHLIDVTLVYYPIKKFG